MQKRLALSFLMILLLFGLNLGIYLWGISERTARMEAVRQAVSRQLLIAGVKQHLGDLQQEMGLLGEVFGDVRAGGVSKDEKARFDERLTAVRGQIAEIRHLSDGAGATSIGELERIYGQLEASWRIAYDTFGRDDARSISERSQLSDRLAQKVMQELVPRLEGEERQRVEWARSDFNRVGEVTRTITLVIFAISIMLVIAVARGVSRYLLLVNQGLERRVDDRTKELKQEIEERKRTEGELARSLSLQRATFESTADGLLVVDRAGKIISFNQKFADMWRLPARILESGDDNEALAFVLNQLRDPQGFLSRVRQLYDLPDEESYDFLEFKDGRVFERYSQPQQLEGAILGRVWSFRDVTEQRNAEGALRESEERYALAAGGANDGLWDWNLKTNEAYYSSRWKAMLGWTESEIGTSPDEWLSRVHPDDIQRVRTAIEAHLEGGTTHFEDEHRVRHADGSYRWILTRGLAVRDATGKPYRMAGSQTDITQRKMAEAQLMHDAMHDALTGLPNRSLFMDRLALALARTKRRDAHSFAVLFLDLDRFKVVNDGMGHMVGDRLLVEIARRLEVCVRPGDTVARLGGDEFTLLLDKIEVLDEAIRVAERIQKDLMQPFNLNGQEVVTTASIGIALGGKGYERPEDLLRDSDTAMYCAKALGKARYQVFDEGMRERAVALLQLETNLRRAIGRKELRVQYQPIVALKTGRITALEALCRWEHRERGIVPPSEFIPVAEETGLIVPIGRWILNQACRQLKAWQEKRGADPLLAISVNLSGREFMQPDLIAQIRKVLESNSLDPRTLRLEITESTLVENTEAARETLDQLRALSVQVHIDDFGTGYSSMSYLRNFRIDMLKIDRSFVNAMGLRAENPEIVHTVITLAHNLGMEVIAEGVQTPDQVARLVEMGCEYGQGYYFSQPVTEAEATTLLDEVTVSPRAQTSSRA